MDYLEFTQHTCRLDNRHDMVTISTPPGFMYGLRVWLRRWTMSSDTDQLLKMYLKSDYALRLDRKKHYNLHYWTIHPLSDALSFWEQLYIMSYVIWIVNFPFTLDVLHVHSTCIYINFILDLVFIADMCVNFFRGYLLERRKEIVLDRRVIMKKYLISFFVVDVISSFPWNMLFYLIENNSYYVWCLRALRLVRAVTMIKLVGVQQLRHGLSDMSYKVVTMIMTFIFCLWGSSTMVLGMSYRMFALDAMTALHPQYVAFLFLRILHKTTMIIVLIDSGYEQDLDIDEALSSVLMVFCHIIGFILQLVILTMLMMIVSSMRGTAYKFKVLQSEVDGYCDFKKVPRVIRERMETYYNFKYQKKFYDEQDINSALTDHLRNEFQVASVRRLVETVDIFAELSVRTQVEICLSTRLEYYLRNDVLTERDVHCDNLFLIRVGTVALFDTNKKEICHLEDGCCIGDLSMLFNVELNMPTVVAVSPCEVYVLRKRDFEALMRKHKDELMRMQEIAQDKLQKTLHVMQTQGYNFIPPQVVVSECLSTED